MASESLNVLLVGGGGREHSLAWKLKQSPRCATLFATPEGMSNPGIAALAKPIDFPWEGGLKDPFRVQRWCVTNKIGLAVVGPEEPLCAGLADVLRQASVPTAEGRSFTDYETAKMFLDSRTEPHVIKACGLAKGKGVFVPST